MKSTERLTMSNNFSTAKHMNTKQMNFPSTFKIEIEKDETGN
jgi:hypothetical protein